MYAHKNAVAIHGKMSEKIVKRYTTQREMYGMLTIIVMLRRRFSLDSSFASASVYPSESGASIFLDVSRVGRNNSPTFSDFRYSPLCTPMPTSRVTPLTIPPSLSFPPPPTRIAEPPFLPSIRIPNMVIPSDITIFGMREGEGERDGV